MRKFDTKVQHLKYKVLREVAKQAWDGTLIKNIVDIPKIIVPGNSPTMRCCVYKERAILTERIKLAMGGNKDNPNVIEVIDLACDECPVGGYEVTNACRGCLAHRCEDVCKQGAISFNENHEAYIDKSKCVECGACAKVCPYSAITNNKRPCEKACKIKAISMSKTKTASIDNDKCISCGACAYQCPFGAIQDKSYILDVIDLIKKKKEGNYRLVAVVAPAMASQFVYAELGQVVSGIKMLGFDDVKEAALGADIVADAESKELVEKGFLTTSCCPAFVQYVVKNFPEMIENISHNLSPMAAISKYIKENSEEEVKIVFIGPCTAKKMESKIDKVSEYVDSVITFEELQALFDSKNIDITELEKEELEDASYYGRIFARSCGVTDAVKQGLKEHGDDFELKPYPCDGIDECRVALLKARKGVLDANFIEGMACEGGCIGGAGCLTHAPKNRVAVEKYSKEAADKTITDSVKEL